MQPQALDADKSTATKSAATIPMRRVVAASVFGTAMETYDLYLYGTAAALIFGTLFFPAENPTAATLLSLSTFAVSFIARPLGAIVFGHFGDRIGRKRMLFITLLLMGISTFLIGLLPSFATIGVAAPIILTVLRFTQGFGFGGEYSGAVLMLAEHAPAKKRGFYAGLNNVGPVIGFLSSTLIFLLVLNLMTEDAFFAWGWRIPFLLSIILVGIGLYVRFKITESPVFVEAQQRAEASTKQTRAPLFAVLTKYPKEVILASGANIGQFATFYLAVTWALSYGTTGLGLERNVILSAVMIAVATNAITIPLASAWSDRVGRKPVLVIGSIAMIVWAFPFFALFNTAQYGLIVIAFIGLMIAYSLVYGPIAAFTSELFGTSVRYTGSALSYNIGGILGAAFAPLIATMLYANFNSSAPIAIYLAAAAAVSLVCILLARETKDESLTLDRAFGDNEG
jgi:metabolite-proton symporter